MSVEALNRGSIRHREAYAQGKMLDHSCWQYGWQSCYECGCRKLPRCITASDIDVVFGLRISDPQSINAAFDNAGKVILAEFSSRFTKWTDLRRGQLGAYEALIQNKEHCAVLCKHNVAPSSQRDICSRHDIVSFQPMIWDHGLIVGSLIEGSGKFEEFVFNWFDDAVRERRSIIGIQAGLRRGWQP